MCQVTWYLQDTSSIRQYVGYLSVKEKLGGLLAYNKLEQGSDNTGSNYHELMRIKGPIPDEGKEEEEEEEDEQSEHTIVP